MEQKTLKLLCLNAWGGMIGAESLEAFFEKYKDVDIFCLQEIFSAPEGFVIPKNAAGKNIETSLPDLLDRIQAALTDHENIFTLNCFHSFGIAMFYKKSLLMQERKEVCIYREPGYVSSEDIADHCRNMQFVKLQTPIGEIAVCNLHGAWQVNGKTDSPERIEQSRRIIEATKDTRVPTILCGDFNLVPDTTSIAMLEDAGWENLVKQCGVTSTRTHLYDKPTKFADYVFVKNGIRVKRFEVLPDVVSDHVPFLLEFEVE